MLPTYPRIIETFLNQGNQLRKFCLFYTKLGYENHRFVSLAPAAHAKKGLTWSSPLLGDASEEMHKSINKIKHKEVPFSGTLAETDYKQLELKFEPGSLISFSAVLIVTPFCTAKQERIICQILIFMCTCLFAKRNNFAREHNYNCPQTTLECLILVKICKFFK